MKIQKITIVGGTHGNEYTGPYLLDLLKKRVSFSRYSTFELKLFFANPKAYENNVRFIDFDLNRSFLVADLSNYSLDSYEANRAKVINQILGPKEDSKTDLIIDIHSTTANMGVSIILVNDNIFNLQLASYIKFRMPNVFIYYIPSEAYSTNSNDHPFLNSLAKYGFALELGPIPNGVVRHDILSQAYDATLACLEFVEKKNKGLDVNFKDEIEVYEYVKTVEFPLDSDGRIDAIIHKNIQDMDYKPLEKGAPIFEKLDGKVVLNHEDELFFPVFINEAAYYDKNIAFSLTKKKKKPLKNTISANL